VLREEIERLVDRALAEPGLVPVPTADGERELERVVADVVALASVPARSWDPAVLRLWSEGLVYLRDGASGLSPRLSITATRLVLRESWVGPFCSIAGDGVLLDRTRVSGHSDVVGPVALVQSVLDAHVVVGPDVVVLESALLPFSTVRREVRIAKSGIGSHSVLDGETPPGPLPAGTTRDGAAGVTVGPGCWIGQQVALSAGAHLGKGVVVTSQTSVARAIPDHVVVAGAPSKTFPIDLNIRGLTPNESRKEGREQGIPAIALPVYGPVSGALTGPTVLELDYADHGFLRELTSENLLHFQAGALEAAIASLFPDARHEVGFAIGRSVRFRVEFERPPLVPVAPDRLRVWRALCNSPALPPFRSSVG
jgi:acetyltransferase-like isoleucine patch superfamily enzyme